MHVTFSLRTPPPVAVAGSIPPRHEALAPVPYIQLDSGRGHHSHEVVDRPATEADQKQHPAEWARFLVEQWLAGKSVGDAVRAEMFALGARAAQRGEPVEPEALHAEAVRRLAPPPPPVAPPAPQSAEGEHTRPHKAKAKR
ncbi:MAG TPA: hypothetical protein VFP50_15385 [Anaeromyxobacteraceae bacterium]|nr:hypothetical protein [Anaeromyxobacteraceae bacterium]